MFSRLRSHRWWRLLLAAFLVPVALLHNPSTAAAAGPWQQVSIQMDVLGAQDWVGRKCVFNARNTTTAVEVGTGGYCTGLPDASMGGLQPGEAGSSFVLTFDGQNTDGTGCGATYGGTLGPHPLNGTVQVAGSIPSGSSTITGGTDPTTCTVTEVCLRLMDSEFACVGATLEGVPEEDPEGSCGAGTPAVSGRWESNPETLDPGNPLWRRWDYVVNFTHSGNPLSTASWGLAVRPGGPVGAGGHNSNITTTAKVTLSTRNTYNDPNAPTDTTAGMEVYAYVAGGWNAMPPDDKALLVGNYRPTDPAHTYMGWTQPQHCRFYFGPKIVADSGSDEDEPFGDGTTQPPVPTPTAEPTIVTPPPVEQPEDEKSWLAAIWAVLQSIWNAIKAVGLAIGRLAGAIVDGVVQGVKSLFVPDETFFDRKVNSVDQSMEGSTVDNYVEVFSGLAPSGSSGCSGPAVTLPFGGGGTFTPLDSCSGPMATAAGVSRTVIGVGFAVTAFFACLRILGSGFGWNPAPSGGVQ